MSLIVVGSVAFDAIETPFGKTDKIIGGAGSYIALASSYFKTNPRVISVVGEDFPKEYLDLLSSHDIDIKGIEIKKGEKTFFWSGKYHKDMNQRDTLITELNVLEKFDPKVPSEWKNVDFLMLGNLSPVVQRLVIERLDSRPKLIAMDTMNFWMNILSEELARTIAMVDVLIINDEEARQLSGENSLFKAAHTIFKMGPKYLIIKKGEHGALLFGESNVFYAPALPLEEVFDPTGAGDTFAGGFIGYLAQHQKTDFESMKSAVIAGSAMASFAVEKFGTERIQNLSEKEINLRVEKFKELIRFSY
jgi:sugar/nucleoside kinase (ribokinase family)